MDDYMKEMMDLKTLVTKTLEKKGVLARIRAELRANVFQAIEEQDHVSESEGADSFALLGRCSERAKQLHATPAGKLLTGLLCEYFEWSELDRTLKVYLPELNQPKPYSRSELEELLEMRSDKNATGVPSETRPLLLEILEGYLKSETTGAKGLYGASSSSFHRASAGVGSKAVANGSEIEEEDLRGALDSRLSLSNKIVDQRKSLDTPLERCSGGTWHAESHASVQPPPNILRTSRSAILSSDGVSSNKPDDSLTCVDKLSGRSSLMGALPPITGRRGVGPVILTSFSGSCTGLLPLAGGNHGHFSSSATGMQINPGTGDPKDTNSNVGCLRSKRSSEEEKASSGAVPPGSVSIHQSQEDEDQVERARKAGNDYFVKTGAELLSSSQEDSAHLPPALDKRTSSPSPQTLRYFEGLQHDGGTVCHNSYSPSPCSAKSASAYFYSESDDDASIVAEGVDDSDEQGDP